MVVFSSSAEIDATLVEIVACASTNAHIVKIALVFVACRCIQHEAVGHKIARMRVKSEAEAPTYFTPLSNWAWAEIMLVMNTSRRDKIFFIVFFFVAFEILKSSKFF